MSRNGKPNAPGDFVGPRQPLKGVLDAATEASLENRLYEYGKMPVEQLARETGRLTSDSFKRLYKEAADAIRKAATEKVHDAKAAQEQAARFTASIVADAEASQAAAEEYAKEVEEVGAAHAENMLTVATGVSSLHALIQAERAKTVNPTPTVKVLDTGSEHITQ